MLQDMNTLTHSLRSIKIIYQRNKKKYNQIKLHYKIVIMKYHVSKMLHFKKKAKY